MAMIQEIILSIDHIAVISWDIQLLQDLFYTGIHNRLLLSMDTIMLVLMNIIRFLSIEDKHTPGYLLL